MHPEESDAETVTKALSDAYFPCARRIGIDAEPSLFTALDICYYELSRILVLHESKTHPEKAPAKRVQVLLIHKS